MLYLTPRHTPGWRTMCDRLGAHPDAIARSLGVSPRTVYRWNADDQAPRVAALALYWLTPWGQDALISDYSARLANAEGLASALERDAAGLRARIARLERLGDFGAANAPVLDPTGAAAWPA